MGHLGIELSNESTNESSITTFEQLESAINNKQEFKFTIKKYISNVEKELLITNLLGTVVEIRDDGLSYINYSMLNLIKDLYLLRHYVPTFSLNEESDMIAQYDFMKENKVFTYIVNNMDGDEWTELNELIHNSLTQRVKLDNSLEGVLSKGIIKIMNKIPDIKDPNVSKLVDKLAKAMKNFDPANYKLLQNFMKDQKGETV